VKPEGTDGTDNAGRRRSRFIARHGNRPNPVPTSYPTKQRLPGAINVAFYDGHSQTVSLENLWTLYWNKAWGVPNPRP
jgi:prepilin-type processing-associated H-X9-DG protein